MTIFFVVPSRVGAGQNFSVFVSSTGLVMTTGDGKYGALGHGDWNSVVRPKLIGQLAATSVGSELFL